MEVAILSSISFTLPLFLIYFMCWAETTPTHSLKQQPVAPLNDLPFLYLNEASIPTFISVNVSQRSNKGFDLFQERNEWLSFWPGDSKAPLMESSHENVTCCHISQICSATWHQAVPFPFILECAEAKRLVPDVCSRVVISISDTNPFRCFPELFTLS